MAMYRSMTAERVRQFAGAWADGRSVANMATGQKIGRAEYKEIVTGKATIDQVLARTATPKIGAELAKLTERVTDDQVMARQDWMLAATEYVRNYAGDFDFLVDLKSRVDGGLTVAQLRGVINCMRAEAIRIVKAREGTAAAPKSVEAAATILNAVADGFYTVLFGDGTHVTIRINSVSAKQSRNGRAARYAAYLCGPSNTSDYRRFAVIDGNSYRAFHGFARQAEALKVLMGADENAQTVYGKAYAQQSGNCYRCGRLLTDPDSISAGIGPICAGRE